VFVRQVAPVPKRNAGYLRHQQQVDFRPFDLESGVLVTCDVGYLCANFTLPEPLRSRVRPDVRDRQTSDVRQTDVRQNHSVVHPPYGCGEIISRQKLNTRSVLSYGIVAAVTVRTYWAWEDTATLRLHGGARGAGRREVGAYCVASK